MKRNTLMMTLAVVTGLLGTAASAGYRYTTEVVIDTANRHAKGSLADARASADNLQFIGCSTRTSSGGVYVSCSAQDANGVSVTCTSSNSSFVQVVAALASDSTLYMEWDSSGNCTSLTADNYSNNTPKQP